jgi:DNA-binding MarR family transcriptional regulator
MSRSSTRSDRRTPLDSVDEHLARAAEAFPDLDLATEAIVTRIEKLDRYLTRSMSETLAHHDLSEGEYKVLVKLRVAGEPHRLSPGDLSRELLLSTGAMTNRLDGLEERGLVTRMPDPDDRRGVLVELSDRGRDVIDAAVDEQAAKEAQLIDALDARQKRATNDLLRTLLLHFEQLMGPYPRHRDADG